MEFDLSTEKSVESVIDGCGDVGEPARIARCRFAERSDIPKIARLVRCRTFDAFSDVAHPGIVYERACLSLLQENEVQEIVSAIFLCNYPNVPAIPPWDWPNWMNKIYNVENSTELNTLFVHFLVWDDRYKRDFLPELLTATFYTAVFCTHVVLVQPPGIAPADVIRKEMTRVAPKNEAVEVEAQVLYVSDERRFIPEIKFRLVVEEDNDDVIQILDVDCKALKEFYGEFYISEMMRHPVESRRIIVSEKENSIATVMCLNRNVDLNLLNDKFELAVFAGLRKTTPEASSSAVNEVENVIKNQDTYDEKGIEGGSIDNKEAYENEYFEGYEEFEESSSESEIETLPGEPDAFAMELLGFRNCVDELRSRELLRASFECLPDLDYCLTLVPTNVPHFCFLDHFTRVPLKADKDYPMALYVTHRAIFQSRLRTRAARPYDYQAIARLLDGLVDAQAILHEFYEIFENCGSSNRCRCNVLTCDDVVVGLAILCVEDEVERLRRTYRLEDLVPRLENAGTEERLDAGRLLRLAVMPIFGPHLDTFLAEVMRLAGLQVLFHRATLEPNGAHVTIDVSPCLSVMQAVKPRIRNWPQFQRFYQREVNDSPFDELFSLFVLSPRLSMITKEIVNTKIVVVGASDCGLSFIDSLALGYKYRDLQFADITLISLNGVRYHRSSDYLVKIMTPFRARYCHAYKQLTPGRANYNFIKGTVVGIDREKRRVHIKNCGSISYDYLILTCGLLFQRPELKNDSHHEEKDLEVPSNCFLINDDVDAENCLIEIRRLTEDYRVKKSIVFYGCNIECYCALGAFLEAGLEASWITLIEPKPFARDDAFRHNSEIKKTLYEVLETIGVTVVSSCDLVDWLLGEDDECIESLLVESETAGRALIACDALISINAKRPCIKTFLAISQAGLVFNGRLVIDAEFRTNDPRVFAAGTLTKYSRKLRAAVVVGLERVHYNSLEVGEKLAEKFVNIIMNNVEDDEPVDSENLPRTKFDNKLPDLSYKMPIAVSCILPGGYRYLHVQMPGIRSPAEFNGDPEAHALDDVFTTGSCTADTGYFRLRLNQFHTVECVTCFSKTDFDIQNVVALCGKHEALLNDIRDRFSNSQIPDFYVYFREPWAAALFSDDFDTFRTECRGSPTGVDFKQTITNEMLSRFSCDNYAEISAEDREELVSACLEKSCYLQEMEDGLSEFLERREDELPMYKTSRKERQILREIEHTPLVYRDDA